MSSRTITKSTKLPKKDMVELKAILKNRHFATQDENKSTDIINYVGKRILDKLLENPDNKDFKFKEVFEMEKTTSGYDGASIEFYYRIKVRRKFHPREYARACVEIKFSKYCPEHISFYINYHRFFYTQALREIVNNLVEEYGLILPGQTFPKN